jgi:hypothetical protein
MSSGMGSRLLREFRLTKKLRCSVLSPRIGIAKVSSIYMHILGSSCGA